jgi:hypothetical protein
MVYLRPPSHTGEKTLRWICLPTKRTFHVRLRKSNPAFCFSQQCIMGGLRLPSIFFSQRTAHEDTFGGGSRHPSIFFSQRTAHEDTLVEVQGTHPSLKILYSAPCITCRGGPIYFFLVLSFFNWVIRRVGLISRRQDQGTLLRGWGRWRKTIGKFSCEFKHASVFRERPTVLSGRSER